MITVNNNSFVGQTENCGFINEAFQKHIFLGVSRRHSQLSLSNLTTVQSSVTNVKTNQSIDGYDQNLAIPINKAVGNSNTTVQTSVAVSVDPVSIIKTTSASISEANFASTSANPHNSAMIASMTTTSAANPLTSVHLVTKSGLWLVAKDTDGQSC